MKSRELFIARLANGMIQQWGSQAYHRTMLIVKAIYDRSNEYKFCSHPDSVSLELRQAAELLKAHGYDKVPQRDVVPLNKILLDLMVP